MIAVVHRLEPEPRVESLGGNGRRDGQRSDVSCARRALDLGHQQLADAPALNIGSHEDRADHVSVEACCSNYAAADGGDKHGALSDQPPHGIGLKLCAILSMISSA